MIVYTRPRMASKVTELLASEDKRGSGAGQPFLRRFFNKKQDPLAEDSSLPAGDQKKSDEVASGATDSTALDVAQA